MAYCRKCGSVIDDGAVICPHCGVEQRTRAVVNDDGSILWGILGFLIPLVGLILWIVWYDSKPKSSKMAGMGALIAVLLAVVIWVLLIVFAAVFASTQ